jgi:nucleoside-diphosphate-sugar epimerase
MYESYVPTHLTDPLWQRLSNARLFITGGTGLFGHWLLDSLTDANKRLNLKIEATVLTRNPAAAKTKMSNLDSRIRFIYGGVENFELPKEKFDVIVHMATTSAEETYKGTSQTNKLSMLYEGTQRILALAKSAQASRILFTSSGAVYGTNVYAHAEETYPTQVNTLNAEAGLAIGKGVAEYLLSQNYKEYGLEVVIARCFAFVGPGLPMNIHYAIGNFIRNVVEGKPIIINGDGRAIRSYMFMGDLVWWLLKILLDGIPGEAYNVGSDSEISIIDLAQKISKLSPIKSEIILLGEKMNNLHTPIKNIYVPNIQKAKDQLNLKVSVELNSAISIFYKYHLK